MSRIPAADLEHILEHTRGLWEPMRGQNLFITGGTGFFGRWLLESFIHINRRLGLGAEMTVLTRNPEAFLARAPHIAASGVVRFVRGDVKDLKAGSERYPYLIHAATEASLALLQSEPLTMFDTALEGTRAALAFAAASGTRRFLLTSSGAVYGKQPSDMTHIPETYMGGPDTGDSMSAYGEGKRAAELLCACYRRQHPGLAPVVARCFAFVGPFLPIDLHFAIGNFIRDALNGGPIQVGGDGSPYRSYLYAADLAVWLWTLLFKGEAGVAYNVGSAEDLDIESLARAVARHAQPPCEVRIARERTAGAPPSRYVPDVTRIVRELNLPPIIGLGDAIDRTFAFYREL